MSMLELISLIIVILTSGALALSIYFNDPKSDTNKAFVSLAATIIFWSITMYLSLLPQAPSHTLFFIRLSMLAAVMLTTSALFLSLSFPHKKLTIKRSYSIFILSLSLLAMITSMSPYLFTGLKIHGQNIEPTPGPGMAIFIIPGIGYSLASILILIRKYQKSQGIQKKQLGIVLFGLVLMFALLISANFLLVVVFKSSSFIGFGPLFTLTFLGSTAYAITKHRLLEIRLIVARAASYAVLTLFIIGIYATFLLTIPNLVDQKYHDALTIILGIILAYSFNPLLHIIEKLTKNIFYKQPYSSEKLLERLGEIHRSNLELDKLTQKVLQELINTLHLTWGAFIIDSHSYNQSNSENIFTKTVGLGYSINLSTNIIHNLKSITSTKVVVYEDFDEGPEKMLLRYHDISVIIPLTVKNNLHGIIILGKKSSGEVYSQQDISVLEIFMPQISVAIQNALSYDEINRFNLILKQEIKAATKKLRDSNRALKKLDKLKDDFIYIATHELKNPVTAMKGYLSLINDGVYGDVPKKLQMPIKQLSNSSHELVVLINDLLQIARIEADSINLHPETFDLCSLTDVVLSGLAPLAKQKNLKLIHSCPKNSPKVIADPHKVREVLNNLISNAIKYTNSGSITISHNSSSHKITTQVKDTGVGISQANQAKLFNRFYRVEKEAAKGIPGTGLGLYISKQLVEKMGGEIWLDSAPGKGSSFYFSLPESKQ